MLLSIFILLFFILALQRVILNKSSKTETIVIVFVGDGWKLATPNINEAVEFGKLAIKEGKNYD